jgi:hypothetical protein
MTGAFEVKRRPKAFPEPARSNPSEGLGKAIRKSKKILVFVFTAL